MKHTTPELLCPTDFPTRVPSHNELVRIIRSIRVTSVISEYEIHDAIYVAMCQANLHGWAREFILGPRNRIDFFFCGVGIEIKKGKVLSSRMQEQAARYLAFGVLKSLIVVIERSVFDMPREINGKPVTVISLNKQWGIAL